MTGSYSDPRPQPSETSSADNSDDARGGRHHSPEASSVIRIPELERPWKAPPTVGWRKAVYKSSFSTLNLGKSRPERDMDGLIERIQRPIRHRYVIAVMSGASAGKTTLTAALGQTFKLHRTAPVLAIDAAPGFGPLAARIAENPPGDIVALLKESDVQGYSDVRQYLGYHKPTGLEVLAGHRGSTSPRTVTAPMFDAVMDLLTRSGHEILLVDCGDDPEHPVMPAVLNNAHMLVLVSGLTADAAVPVERTVDWLKAAGFHRLVSRLMIILNDRSGQPNGEARAVLRERFEKLDAVVEDMPFDRFLARGGIIDVRNELDKDTRLRLHQIAALLADLYVHEADRSRAPRTGR